MSTCLIPPRIQKVCLVKTKPFSQISRVIFCGLPTDRIFSLWGKHSKIGFSGYFLLHCWAISFLPKHSNRFAFLSIQEGEIQSFNVLTTMCYSQLITYAEFTSSLSRDKCTALTLNFVCLPSPGCDSLSVCPASHCLTRSIQLNRSSIPLSGWWSPAAAVSPPPMKDSSVLSLLSWLTPHTCLQTSIICYTFLPLSPTPSSKQSCCLACTAAPWGSVF